MAEPTGRSEDGALRLPRRRDRPFRDPDAGDGLVTAGGVRDVHGPRRTAIRRAVGQLLAAEVEERRPRPGRLEGAASPSEGGALAEAAGVEPPLRAQPSRPPLSRLEVETARTARVERPLQLGRGRDAADAPQVPRIHQCAHGRIERPPRFAGPRRDLVEQVGQRCGHRDAVANGGGVEVGERGPGAPRAQQVVRFRDRLHGGLARAQRRRPIGAGDAEPETRTHHERLALDPHPMRSIRRRGERPGSLISGGGREGRRDGGWKQKQEDERACRRSPGERRRGTPDSVLGAGDRFPGRLERVTDDDSLHAGGPRHREARPRPPMGYG